MNRRSFFGMLAATALTTATRFVPGAQTSLALTRELSEDSIEEILIEIKRDYDDQTKRLLVPATTWYIVMAPGIERRFTKFYRRSPQWNAFYGS